MKKIKLINEAGNEEVYDVLLSYVDSDTKKGYLVYTDGEKKYLASYETDNDNLDLENVENEEEINKIKKIMEQVGV